MQSIQDVLDRLKRTTYSLNELQERPPPEGVDPTRLESYLNDDDFQVRQSHLELSCWLGINIINPSLLSSTRWMGILNSRVFLSFCLCTISRRRWTWLNRNFTLYPPGGKVNSAKRRAYFNRRKQIGKLIFSKIKKHEFYWTARLTNEKKRLSTTDNIAILWYV